MYLKKQFAFLPLIAGAVVLSVCTAAAQSVFTSATGVGSPHMSSVPDVLHGKTTLLPQDDAALVVVSRPYNNADYVTQLIPLDSQNSNFQQKGTVQANLQSGNATSYSASSIVSSSASGRMFNNGNDVVISLGTGDSDSSSFNWKYSYWNPVTGNVQGPYQLQQALEPNANTIYTKVVMGNFQGNNLQSALLFAQSDFGSYVLWQMNIVVAPDPNQVDVIDPYGGGPVISGDAAPPSQAPVNTTIVAGDFNQDGVDEIAVLLRDSQTVLLYTVDPKTLRISPWQTIKLPAALTNPTLTTGRFNNSPNVVLAVIGQQQASINITVDYIDPITNPQNPSVTIVPTTFSNSTLSGGVFEGAFAQAAPLYNTSQNSLEQLVMGLAYEFDSWHALLIGTFDSKYNFVLQEATGYNGCLLGMKVGNFNNLDSSGNVSPNLQIGLLKNFNGDSQCVPPFDNGGDGTVYVEMRNVDVPQNVAANPQAPPSSGPTNWLDSLPRTEIIPNMGGYNLLASVSFLTGDLQGRSERLGAPEHVTLTGHIQPNFVLGMPPMHVDWLQPFGGTNGSCEAGTSVAGQPECILNLDVKPYAVSSDRSSAFTSTYSVTGTDSTATSRKNTSSWGLSGKVTVDASFSYSIPEESSGSLSVKTSVGNVYNNVSSEYNGQYSTKSEQLTTQTGFDDVVFFTAETQNFYNYPVLGKTDAKTGGPLYATFSVPSKVQIGEVGGATLDWYQPIHEPGNVLSYPWSSTALAQQYQPGSISTQASSSCLVVGSTDEVTSVNWTNENKQNVTSGWSDALSENVNISASYSAGGTIFGAGVQATISGSVDVGHSNAWGALNQSVNTATSNQAVALTTPQYDKTAAGKFAYAFQNYVFGTTNAVPTYQDGASILPNQLDVLTTGPLFVGFTADPLNQCGQGGTNFWPAAYSHPDVGFNHPDRWDVSSANEASFNSAVTPSANNPLISQSFYRMKGLLITTGDQSSNSSIGAGTVQSVPAGQPITLTARVYNFSLVSTDQASQGSTVHVRFYGQKRCTVNYPDGQITDFCPNQAFQISGNQRDGDVTISSIPGFNGSSGQPNWAPASVSFDTTGYDNTELVFWAVTWIEDTNGKVLAETPDHGVQLPSFAGKSFANITDIPVEAHSNNVGFYAANHPFYVAPSNNASAAQATALLAGLDEPAPSVPASPANAPLQSINLSLSSPTFRVDQVTNFTAKFTAGAAFPGSTILYFDGDPAQGGKLFDVQTVRSLPPSSSTEHLVRFRAQQCGPHTLYAVSELEDFPATVGSISANVTIDPVSEVTGMITYVQNLQLQPFLEQALLSNLKFAQTRFQAGNVKAGLGTLKVFADLVQLIPLRNNNQLERQTNILLGKAQLVQTCEASLQAAPAVKAARN